MCLLNLSYLRANYSVSGNSASGRSPGRGPEHSTKSCVLVGGAGRNTALCAVFWRRGGPEHSSLCCVPAPSRLSRPPRWSGPTALLNVRSISHRPRFDRKVARAERVRQSREITEMREREDSAKREQNLRARKRERGLERERERKERREGESMKRERERG